MTLDLNNLNNFCSKKMMRFSRSWSFVSPFHMGEFKNQKQGFLASNGQSTPQRGTPNFKWRGWLNGAKKKKPKKSLGLPAIPQKKSRNRKFQTPKNPSIHPRHLKSGVLHMGSTFALQTPRYNGHPFNTDSSWIPDWNKLQLYITDSRSLLRTLNRGPYSVRYKGS